MKSFRQWQKFHAPLGIICRFARGHIFFALVNAIPNNPKVQCQGDTCTVFWDLSLIETRENLRVSENSVNLDAYRAALEYTIYRAVGVLDFSDNGKATDAIARRLFGQPFEPWFMRAWGIFKAVMSLVLLFLFALGLRNKYRIK
jgi:hypothetical protein